ncbi:MAG: hypothetical protein EXS16_10735 [Gemmataceae bacterium]|nr:hypothetical protein [Gemmataceae bacterium]
MPIKTSCLQCQANFELPERLAGKTVRCQKCQATFKVPELPVEPVPAETQPLSPIAVVAPPNPAGEVVVATMVGPPPVEKEEEIVTGKLVEHADTAPQSKPTPSPRSRRPTSEPTGNTGTGAIIAVIVIGLFTCLLLAGGGGAAVFFLVLQREPLREDFKAQKKDWPRRDFDDKKDWDFDDGGKGWNDKRTKTPEPQFDFRTTPAPKSEVPWKTEAPKTTEAPKSDDPKKTEKVGRIEDLPANERVFWQGIEFGTKDNIPGRIISPIPLLEPCKKIGNLVIADANTFRGVSVHQCDLEAGKRVNIGMNSGNDVSLQIHDGNGVIVKGAYIPRNFRVVLSFVPRNTGRHAIFVTSKEYLFHNYSLVAAFPNKSAVEVNLNTRTTFIANIFLTLDDNINPRMRKSSLGLCREFIVDMQIGNTYEIRVNKATDQTFLQIESPEMTLLADGVGEINYRPEVNGKHHLFISANQDQAPFSQMHIITKEGLIW